MIQDAARRNRFSHKACRGRLETRGLLRLRAGEGGALVAQDRLAEVEAGLAVAVLGEEAALAAAGSVAEVLVVAVSAASAEAAASVEAAALVEAAVGSLSAQFAHLRAHFGG